MWKSTVDALIEALASHIKKSVEAGRDMTEETKALAELISARAQCSKVHVVISSRTRRLER